MSSFFLPAVRRSILLMALPLAMAGAVRADEVTDWHEHMLVALGKAGLRPPVSTREAALVSSAVFDSVNGIELRYTPIFVAPGAPRGASKRAAAVQAAYVILLARFPAQADDFVAKRTASLAAIGEEGESMRRGINWGQKVADKILLWRSMDGFSPPPPPYWGSLEEGKWRPTPPAFAPGLLPQLATMTPWAMRSPDQFRPAGPPALGSARYLADFNEVKLMGSANSPLRTEDETELCRFAADTSGTYVWNRLAIDLAAEDGYELSENAKLLATLNLAMADSVIACWDAKYHFELWRPITAIRLEDADGDGNPDDPGWTPLISTPPHPEYTSGHSSNYGAAATVLAAYFGEDTPFFLESQADPTRVRFYPNFSAAIDEVAKARVYAGIHFRTACDDAVAASSAIADYVMENLMLRLHGEGE